MCFLDWQTTLICRNKSNSGKITIFYYCVLKFLHNVCHFGYFFYCFRRRWLFCEAKRHVIISAYSKKEMFRKHSNNSTPTFLFSFFFLFLFSFSFTQSSNRNGLFEPCGTQCSASLFGTGIFFACILAFGPSRAFLTPEATRSGYYLLEKFGMHLPRGTRPTFSFLRGQGSNHGRTAKLLAEIRAPILSVEIDKKSRQVGAWIFRVGNLAVQPSHELCPRRNEKGGRVPLGMTTRTFRGDNICLCGLRVKNAGEGRKSRNTRSCSRKKSPSPQPGLTVF